LNSSLRPPPERPHSRSSSPALLRRHLLPKTGFAPIQILGETEAAGSVFDALWVCGLTDEAWPPRRTLNAFLPAALQQQAGVPGSSSELAIGSARLVLRRLVASAADVVLSSARSDGDREVRVSSLVEHLPTADTSSLSLSRARRWGEVPVATCEELVDSSGPPIADAELSSRGTSVIESQSLCPFRAFAEWRLAAAKLEDPSAGIRANFRGNVVERSLELVWVALREQHVLVNTDEAKLQAIIVRSVDTAFRERPESGDPLHARLVEIERERLIKLVHEWLGLERLRDKFEVFAHQQSVEVELGGMTVKGRIDRIDRVDEGFVVIDYKTGADYKPGHWKLPRPQRPQLPLYVVALEKQGREVAGLTFAKVRTGECELAGGAARPQILGKRSLRPKLFMEDRNWKEMVAAWEKEFAKLASAHLTGRAEVDPKDPPRANSTGKSSCDRCHLGALCRVSELNLQVMADDDGSDDEQE
jgi:ATP-dependent helicase/nuclease subunit B